MKYYYTDLAWHILTSEHKDQYKYEFFHDETISAIVDILTFNDDPDFIETKLQDLLRTDSPAYRIAQYYMLADDPQPIKLYKKRKKRNVPEISLFNKKKEISFNRVGAELVRNFMRQGYEKTFPQPQQHIDFIQTNTSLSAFQLAERIEEYMTIDDEDEDDAFLGVMQTQKEYADSRRAYLLAIVLLWKSKNAADLYRAIEQLEDIEVCLKDEFEAWKECYLAPEFYDGADEQFDALLWQMVCSAAYQCKDEIYEAIDNVTNNLPEETEEEDIFADTEDLIIVDFFSDIVKYMDASSAEIKEEAFYALKEQYRDMCQHIENDIFGDFDDETGEYKEE